jgi:glutathione S-transferase
MRRLYAESFAPWCDKARWALDHHGVAYDYVEHVPLMGELSLRLAARRPLGRVTVPLLVDDRQVLMDSFEIARHAERVGSGAALFPPHLEPEIARWNERSETLMASGRAMLMTRMAASRAALREQLPPFVPSALRGVLSPVAGSGVKFLVRKYAIDTEASARHERESREVLDALRAALADGRSHLLGELTYADITMAAALQFFCPVDDRHIALGPATRAAWTHERLAADYADLVAWRDRLYAKRS